ncbi:MAG: zinc ABC transporter substrate-binding protein [Elusimicrobia bacterium]|nr:zinc ABC transporter substrate-binding protein [Elusimicrobiota bacterium]
MRVFVGPNKDAHTHQPTPDDVRLLADAQVLVFSGAHFEPWLAELIRSSRTKAKLIDLSKAVSLRRLEGPHGEIDPHYWNDARNAQSAIPALRAALAEVFPDQTDDFSKREQAYLIRLRELDEWVRSSVEKVPVSQRKLVTAHDSIGYWADAYGFDVVGTAFGALTTEAADPSARQIKDLVDVIRAQNVKSIFAENFGNPGLIQRVARDAGVRLAPPLYTDALGPPGGPASSYMELIRYNTRTIVESLK